MAGVIIQDVIGGGWFGFFEEIDRLRLNPATIMTDAEYMRIDYCDVVPHASDE